jgi:hypothetical protein
MKEQKKGHSRRNSGAHSKKSGEKSMAFHNEKNQKQKRRKSAAVQTGRLRRGKKIPNLQMHRPGVVVVAVRSAHEESLHGRCERQVNFRRKGIG